MTTYLIRGFDFWEKWKVSGDHVERVLRCTPGRIYRSPMKVKVENFENEMLHRFGVAKIERFEDGKKCCS